MQIAAAGVVGAIIASMSVLPAQAATGDVSEGEGVLLSGSGLVNADAIAQLKGAYSSSTSTSGLGAVSNPLDVSALSAINLDLGNGVRLLGQNGLLTLGVDGQYANTSTTGASASSGLVSSDGSIAVGSGTPGGTTTLNLAPLFSRVGANAQLASTAQLNIGALASRIQATRGSAAATPTTSYGIASANVQLTSPAIAGLNSTLQTTVNSTSSALNNLISSQGVVNSLTSNVTGTLNTAVQTLIPGATLGTPTVSVAVNGLNLSAVTVPVLAQKYTSGPVSIVPSTGSVTIDLNTLQALNNQPANTKLLSTQALQDVVTGAIKDILVTQLPAALNTAIVSALGSASVKVTVSAAPTLVLLGAPVNVASVNVSSTIPLSNLIAGGTSTPATTTANISAVANLVTINANAVAPALAPVFSGISSTVGTLLSPTLNGLLPALTTTLTAANGILAPLVGIINQVVSITVNAQDTSTGFHDPRGTDAGASSVHALRLSILPLLNAANVDLATSTIATTTIAPVAIASPTANQQFTVATSTSTRSIPVSGTGEPGSTIAVDLGQSRTGSATVAADGTWSTTVAGVGAGTVTATATQTFGGVAGTPVTRTFSVVAQQPLVITAPTASQQFLVVSPTATRPITVSGTSTPGASIALDLGSGLTATTTADGSGTWSTPVAGVGTGSYTISATQASGGVTSAPVTRAFSVVAGAGLTVSAPTANTRYVVPGASSTTTVTVTGSAQPGATVTADLGAGGTGSATAAADGSYSIPVANVPVGGYTVSVTQTVGGGVSAAITRPITVVAASPVVIQQPVAGGTFTVAGPLATTPVTVSGTAESGATVQVQLLSGGTPTGASATVTADINGTWTAPFTNVGVADYTASVTQTVAGITSTPVTRDFSVAAATAVTITSPASGSSTTVADPTSTIPVTVTGQAQANTPVTVSFGSGRTQTVTSSGTGSWSAPFTGVPVGGYTITATQAVNGTTSTPVTSTYSIVAGAPVTVTSPVDGATVATAGPTSNADVTFRGTAQPGALVTLSLGGGLTGTATAGSDGSWSIPIASVPAATYTVTTHQKVGTTTSPDVTQALTVKAGAAVAITSPADGDSTEVFGASGSATVPVTGTAQPGAQVTVSLGAGAPAQSVTASAAGSWSASFDSVPVGDYTLAAFQTINGGTSDAVTQTFHVKAGGAIVIQQPANGASFLVADSSGKRTTTVSGMGSPDATVVVTLTGGLSRTVTASDTGSWTATFADLPVAAYTVNASQSVTVGGPSVAATPTTFTIAAADDVVIIAPADGSTTILAGADSTLPVAVSGTAQPDADITVTVAGQTLTTTASDSGAWSVTTTPLGVQPDYTATVTQTVNGTTSAGVSSTFSIAKGADFLVQTPIDGSTLTVADVNGTQDVRVSGSGEIGASVAVTTGTITQTTRVGLDGTWTTKFLGLKVGDHAFRATETVGATSSLTAPDVTVHIVAARAATITEPGSGDTITVASSTAKTPVTVSGTAPDATTVTVALGGALVKTDVPVVGGTWTTTFDALPVGAYTASVTQTVNGTTSAPVTSPFTVAAGAPVVVTAPVDGSTVTVATSTSTTTVPVSGTAEPGATVKVSLGDGLTGSVKADDDGSWSVPIADVPASTTPYTVTVSQSIGGTTSTPVTSTVSVIAGAELVITTPTPAQKIVVADDVSTTDVVVAGTGQPGATIALTVNGGTPIPITVRNSGSWSTTLADQKVDGYTLSAVETVDGTSTPAVTRSFSIVGSAVTITAPAPNATVVVPTASSTTDVVVTGTAAAGATVTATTDTGLAGSGTANAQGAYSVTIADVPVSTPTISVTQSIGGTVSPTPSTVKITVAAAADLTITAPAPGAAFTVPTAAGTVDVVLKGAAQPGAPVSVSLGSGLTATANANDAGLWTATVSGVPVGSYTASVTQTIAGTVSDAVTEKLSVGVAAPVVITEPTDAQSFPIADATDTVTVPVSGTAEPGASVTVTLDGTSKTVTANATTGAWSTSFDGIGEGPKTVSVTEATDDGPTTPALAAITVDVAPAAKITSPVAGQSIEVATGATTSVPVSGTGLAGSDISVTLDGTGTPQTTTVSPAGTWDVSFDGVGAGSHTVSVTQTVNGSDQDPATVAFTVDAVATPVAPVEITSPDAGTSIPDVDGDGFVDVPVSGTGQPGSTVTVTLNDGQTATTTVGDDGTWSFVFHHVPVGVIRIVVIQTTGGTTTGSDQVGVTADTIDPAVISTPVSGDPVLVTGATATADVPVSGTGEPGATVTVDIAGHTGTATVGDGGGWSTTVTGVPVGDHTISVVERSDTTTLPAVTQPLSVKVGTGVTISDPATGSTVTVLAAGSTATLPVTGTADPGATVTVTLDGGQTKTVNAANDGSWSVTFTSVAVGDRTVSATEQLADGPTDAVTSQVTVKVAAKAVITTPQDGQRIEVAPGTTTAVVVSGTGEPGATVGVSLDGADGRLVTVTAQGSWTTTFAQVATGAHTASATQTVLGTRQDPTTAGFTVVATTTPVVGPTIQSPSTGQIVRDTDGDGFFDVPVSGSGQPGSTITVDLGAGITRTTTVRDDGTWSVTVTSVPDGARTVLVTQTTGSTTTGSASVQITGAAIAPVAVTSPTPGQAIPGSSVGGTTVTVRGTAEPGATVTATLDNGRVVTTTADGSGAWSIPLTDVPTGTHTVAVSETLGAATSAPVTVAFQVTTAPTAGGITVLSPAPGALITDRNSNGSENVTVSGTAAPGAAVSVNLDDGTILTATADSSGAWSVRFIGVAVGTHRFVATQTVMGTETSAPAQTFSIRAIAPLSIASPPPGSSWQAGPDGTLSVPVTGSAHPGATVTIVLDGGTPVTVTAGADGSWSYTFPQLGAGTHTYVVTQTLDGFTSAPVATTFRVLRAIANPGGGGTGGGGTGGGTGGGSSGGGTGSGSGTGAGSGSGTTVPAGTGGTDPATAIGQALAYTGSTVFPWAVVGAGLLALGLGMLGASRGLSRIRARKR